VARFRRAVLGGTFDRLHRGHEALLGTAFRVGKEVAIGLTTEQYLNEHPKPDRGSIQPYATRRRVLHAWLRSHASGRRWRIVPIDDGFGGSIEPGVGVLVASVDTLPGAAAVNRERRRLGRPPVPVVAVPFVLADDLAPLSSRRIRAGVVDRAGRRTSPIRIDLRVATPSDLGAARRATRSVFPRARFAPSSRGASRPAELKVIVTRGREGGWRVAVRSAAVKLPPLAIAPGPAGSLERGLRALLRPSSASADA
jgi:cytidyltransferase-like protein